MIRSEEASRRAGGEQGEEEVENPIRRRMEVLNNETEKRGKGRRKLERERQTQRRNERGGKSELLVMMNN